jgi:hypothetical protein
MEVLNFESALILATFNKNRALPNTVTRISLHDITNDINELMELSFDDPQHPEYGRPFYVTADKVIRRSPKLYKSKQIDSISENGEWTKHDVLQTPDILGDIKRRSLFGLPDVIKNWLPKKYRQNEFLGTILHTHGISNTPPSPHDFGRLLLKDPYIDAISCVSVVTPLILYLAFRGQNTPLLGPTESTYEVAQWTSRLVQKYTELGSGSNDAQVGERFQHELLLYVAQLFDLRLFEKNMQEPGMIAKILN